VLQVVSKIDEFKPQELANVVWALASMEHYSPELMEVRTAQHSMAWHSWVSNLAILLRAAD
jgi:hypothetical protein